MASTTSLCLSCRLLQATTSECSICGATTVAPVELVRELLGYPDIKIGAERDLGLITLLLAGGSMAVPILLPAAAVTFAMLLARIPGHRRRQRQRAARKVQAVPLPAEPVAPAGAVTLLGAVEPFRGSQATSIIDGAPVIAEEVVLEPDGRGREVLVRSRQSVPFLLRRPSQPPVIVDGALLLVGPAHPGQPPPFTIPVGNPLPTKMGAPADWPLYGLIHVSRILSGHEVSVTGRLVEEALPEHAFHREPGVTKVMRGEPGRPVLVTVPRAGDWLERQ